MPETQKSAITDEMRAVIGKPLVSLKSEVSASGCRMFARAVGHDDLIYYDEDYAKSKGFRNIVAPPAYFGTYTWKPGQAEKMVDYIPNLGGKSLLNGGNEFEYFETVCAGDVLIGTQKIVSLNERAGGMGNMLFVIFQTDYVNESGKLVGLVRHTVIAY